MDPQALGKLIGETVREEIFPSALEDKLKPIQDSLSKLHVAVCGGAKI